MNNLGSSPRRDRIYHSTQGSLPKGRSIYGTSFGKSEIKPANALNRNHLSSTPSSSYKILHHSQNGQVSYLEPSGRPALHSRHTFSATHSPDEYFHSHHRRSSDNMKKSRSSSGLVFSTSVPRELASIDKINDPQANLLVCAGKAHVGIYKFNKGDKSINLVTDLAKVNTTNSRSQPSMFASRRGRQAKFSTISDVKSGFQNYNHFVAVCSNSTAISIYDINKGTKDTDNTLLASLNEHKRSVNSFDFNMVQPHLIISGGQDGCAKVWDLRANHVNGNSRCDISINTAYDSIRDIKWMPSHSFGPSTDDNSIESTRSNAGFEFSSIHDSGVLLKFDLRQPHQFQKKINAHTGPGLCLNWHPNLDYVVTGGRDGKCCLWYIGDKEQQQQASTTQTFANNPLTASNPLVFPETTINFGSPITKLKFCPAYNNEVHNSLLAISSMGDEAQVGIYSLARKYVPKNLLETSAASVGLVWWDPENLFTIDKGNRINGWDLTKQPTVLDNLPKIVSTWRDIDGNGLLFVNQDEGTYDVTDPYLGRVELSDDVTSSTNNNYNNLSTTSVNQIDSNTKRVNTPTPANQNERFSPFKINPSFSSKSFVSSSISSTPSINSSSAPMDPTNNGKTIIESPLIITLDLPKIIGSMRIEHISNYQKINRKKKIDKDSLAKLRESPVELFKYLARELEFSVGRYEYNSGSEHRNSIDNLEGVVSFQDEYSDTQKILMQKFGLSEKGTWANLINKKTDQDKRNSETGLGTASTSGTKSNYQDSLDSELESERTSPISDDILNREHTSTIENGSNIQRYDTNRHSSQLSRTLEAEKGGIEKKMELLVDFVSIASHNASVYANINDKSNMKLWILIRDSILWDLKKIDSMVTEPEAKDEVNHDTLSINSSLFEDDLMNRNYLRKQSMNSDYSRLAESVHTSSLIEEHPEAFRSTSQGSDIDPSDTNVISNLRKQLRNNDEPSHNFATTDIIKELNKRQIKDNETDEEKKLQPILKYDVLDSSAIEIEEEEPPEEKASPTENVDSQQKPPSGIPILQNRKKRPSFIDTFMSDNHSPLGQSEEESLRPSLNGTSRNLPKHYSSSYCHYSPRNKGSSLESATSNISYAPFLKRLSDTIVPTIQESYSFDDILKSKRKNVEKRGCVKPRKTDRVHIVSTEICPPWNTETLLRQIYEQAVETGNMLFAMTILLLFQDVYSITALEIVKNSLYEFIKLFHRYELFEISTALLKYCSWDDIMGPEGGQSNIQLYCDKCGELIINESSKDKFSKEVQTTGHTEAFERFGFWYCDSCKKPNTLCVFCECPIKKLAITVLECGHEGHFECFREWFLDEGMNTCPGGCNHTLNL